MPLLQRLAACWRGTTWLVRGGGLRGELQQFGHYLGDVDRRVAASLDRPPPPPGPADVAVPEMVAATRAVFEGVARVEARLLAVEERLAALERESAAEVRRRKMFDWRLAGDLRGFEARHCSQQGEDGIIQELFRRIGTRSKFFVEFGVETGAECNCAYLARDQGWGGVFLEANPRDFVVLKERYRTFPAIRCVESRVTSANIEAILEANGVPREFDLLSIDVDGNDYWIWQAIRDWSPRAVVIEYNAFHPPGRKWVMKEDPHYVWSGTTYFGASLASLTALGRTKGYTLVGCDSNGVNAFFVRDDCLGGRFLDPVLTYHFSPFGHPPHAHYDGPFVEV